MVCTARVETTVEGRVNGTVASVGDPRAVLAEVLLNLEDEVAGRGNVVLLMVVVVEILVVEGVDLKVFSSVICGLSVTVTGTVVRRTSVTDTGVTVRESSNSDVLLLTVGDAVVRPKPTVCSLVWGEPPSVPPWFWVLELWAPVEDSVEVPTLEIDPRSVPEVFVGPSAGEVMGGVEEKMDTSDCSVVGSVTLTCGVESEVSSDVEVC